LKLQYDEPLFNFAFNFNLRRYNKAARKAAEDAVAALGPDALPGDSAATGSLAFMQKIYALAGGDLDKNPELFNLARPEVWVGRFRLPPLVLRFRVGMEMLLAL